ncbi:MAG: polysaccharide biosynthesis tyrosine autokinase [Herbinix sp.]|nr:polysaccharide biosynthesis tyrosine autokinase [Herbinix sp.]
MELSLSEIISLIIKRLKLIIICVILFASVFYIKSQYLTSPTYTASVEMYVNSSNLTANADLTELTYAQKVVTTYISFLQTKTFYKQVLEKTGLKYGPDQLKAMTTIQSVNNTEIFRISVTSFSPDDSFKLVEAMQSIAPDLIQSIKGTAEISVVDPAVFPAGPTLPNIKLYTLVGGMLGFLFSVIASFLWEIIDVNVKSQEDLKKYEISILGAIPNYNICKRKSYYLVNLLPGKIKHWKFQEYAKCITDENRFCINEAYNLLRTNLRFTVRKDGCKKIIISSPLPDEGKSTTSTNLAITISQTGAKVLLLDCDLRKGMLHTYFKIKSAPGLSNALSGMINEKDVIQYTKYENLHVIAMGVIPPNPTELLGSVQMEAFIKKLENLYDYIIIDSPPVNIVSDTLSMVKMVDGVVIVVKEGVTSHPNIVAAINKYKFTEANILGFVINGISLNNFNNNKYKYCDYSKYKNKDD